MRSLTVALVIIGVVVVNTRTARAQDTEWYGWKLLVADATSTAVVFAGIKGPDKAKALLIDAGVLGLVIAPPILHGLEDGVSGSRVAASIGLRIGLPAVGAITGVLLMGRNKGRPHGNLFGTIAGAIIGAGIGMVAAIAIDDFALARKDVAPGATPRILELTFAF